MVAEPRPDACLAEPGAGLLPPTSMTAKWRARVTILGLLGGVLASCSARPRDGAPPATAAEPSGTASQRSALAATVPPEIRWTPYDEAFARAQREHKPVVLVFTAVWCGHCRTYQGVLTNPEVVTLSERLVMVRVDIDQRPDVNARYMNDGGYVPRTMFFRADGTPRPELRAANRTQYVHFLDTTNPAELLGLMRQALSS